MAIERTYTIPLRSEWIKSVKYKRAKKAVRAIREFLMRHMKVAAMENIKLGRHLNLELWKHGIKNPPSRVKVNVTKDDKGVVTAELFGAKIEKKIEAPKKAAKPAETKAPAEKKAEKPAEEKKAETKPAAPATEKKESPAEKKPADKKPAAPKAPAQPAPQPSAPKQEVGQIIR